MTILGKIGEALFLLAIVAAPWPFGGAPDAAAFALWSAVLIAGSLGVAAEVVTIRWTPFALGLLALAQLGLGRTASPVRTVESLLALVALALAFLFASDRSRSKRLVVAILFVAAAQAVFGAVQWSLGPQRIYGQARTGISMPFGSFVNHNHFAGFVEMAALLALGVAIGHARRARAATPVALGLGGLSLALLLAHLASRSRGGLVALGAGIVAILLTYAGSARKRQGSRGLALAGVSALIVIGFALLAVAPDAVGRFTRLLGPGDLSATYRFDTAKATLRLFAAQPGFGWGLGAYADTVTMFKQGHGDVRITHAESDALEWLAETGLLGASLLLFLGILAARRIARNLREAPDPLAKGRSVGALSAVVALAVHSCFDFNLRIPSNALLFATLLGLACAEVPRDRARFSVRTRAIALFLVAVGVAAGWRAWGAVQLSRALEARDAQERIARLDGTLARHPYLAEAFRLRGVLWRDMGGVGPLRATRLRRAQADLEASIHLRPYGAQAWADLAWVEAMRGDGAAARRHIDQAAALDPTHSGIRLYQKELIARISQKPL